MMELMKNENSIDVKKGSIDFNDFEEVKQKAIQISEYVSSIEVTEESLKDAKKILAESNKVVKRLEDKRIAIKKEILEPYTIFETQVKEIKAIFDEANDLVKSKVKELTDKERDEKREVIKELFIKKTQMLENVEFYKFDEWLDEKYLNKTTSLSKVENELDNYIEKLEKDINFLKKMEESHVLIQYYMTCKDMTKTLEYKQSLEETKEKISDDEFFIEEEKSLFEIEGKANIKLTKMLLEENGINYKERRIK